MCYKSRSTLYCADLFYIHITAAECGNYLYIANKTGNSRYAVTTDQFYTMLIYSTCGNCLCLAMET